MSTSRPSSCPVPSRKQGQRDTFLNALQRLHIVLSILAKSLRSLPSCSKSWKEHPSLQSNWTIEFLLPLGRIRVRTLTYSLNTTLYVLLGVSLRGVAYWLIQIAYQRFKRPLTGDCSDLSTDGMDSLRWKETHDARQPQSSSIRSVLRFAFTSRI